ncbi:hypothetical protein E2C01_055076 [Portunus trituberculatus]|uniref:Uncharacterized protein n=1 Tax=Portunus trituberculatus TaxID=210409 RepID=A0A5B7GWM9_PORTR|nr:hypothetical protein [Portunus trituberculatus]
MTLQIPGRPSLSCPARGQRDTPLRGEGGGAGLPRTPYTVNTEKCSRNERSFNTDELQACVGGTERVRVLGGDTRHRGG